MEALIVAQGLELGYQKELSVLQNASFTINSGDFVFLTGNSGSGKTTLIKSFYGAIKPRSGQLIASGINLSKAGTGKIHTLRRRMGLIFQDYKLVEEWTIRKNVMLPLIIKGFGEDVAIKQADKLLSHVKLTHKALAYPNELSGGEQQRTAVARALVHSPQFIIADEPTGNLDEYSASLIWDLLKTANACGIAIVIATHHIPKDLGLNYKRLHLENKAINALA